MKIFFWAKDEHACPQWTRDNANKLWHGIGSALLCVTFVYYGMLWWVAGAITFGLGIAWEVVVDCWILGKTEKLYSATRCTGIRQHGGASKLNLLADLIGTLGGLLIIFVKQPIITLIKLL